MKRANNLLYNIILLMSDFVALVLAFVGAYIIRVKIDERSLVDTVAANEYVLIVSLLLIVWLVIFSLLGLYRTTIYDNRIREFALLLVGSLIGIQFLITAEYVLDRAVFPARLVVVYGLGLSFAFALLFRTLVRVVFRWRYKRGVGLTNLLIVGNTEITDELLRSLQNPAGGYRVIGVVSDKRSKVSHIKDAVHYATFAEAIKKLDTSSIHAIIQTELYSNETKNDEILTFAQTNHVGYRFVPGNNKLFVGNIEVELFQNIPAITVHQTALTGWGRIVKRLFDVVVSFILLIILSPLFLLIAILQKLTDPKCSVIFSQTRLTRYNEQFKTYKFRSMHSQYGKGSPEDDFILMGRPDLAEKFRENNEHFDNDPRITPLGRFLRASSLDELPQLFNVLRGDISLVGPRALIAAELDTHSSKHTILSVKSGLTGLAVISGRKEIPFEERRRLDLYYVQNWSFWGDIMIIFRTVSVVFFHKGAK